MGTRFKGEPKQVRALDAYIRLVRGTESVTRRIHEHLDEPGLTVSQFGVLEALFHLGSLSQRELCAKLLKSAGNVTMVIDNLVRRGLVRRDREARDRRTSMIDLTPAGRRLISKVFPRHVDAVVREFALLSASDQERLGLLCKKLGKGNV